MDIDEVIEMVFLALNALNLCNIKKKEYMERNLIKQETTFDSFILLKVN